MFRGSDVKDLRIEENPKKDTLPKQPVPDDPAILGVRFFRAIFSSWKSKSLTNDEEFSDVNH